MPARKPTPRDEKPQRERFVETAKEIGASDNPEDFERLFSKVVVQRLHPAPLSDRRDASPSKKSRT